MANIKVSELPTATSFEDDDYVMIVQSNTNKKITKENMYGNYNYSSNEIVVGKWIDDRPIYRKIINYNGTLSAGVNNITHGISDFDSIINISGFVPGTTQYPLGAFVNTTYFLTLEYVDATNVAVHVGSGWGNAFNGLIIIIEYVKSNN